MPLKGVNTAPHGVQNLDEGLLYDDAPLERGLNAKHSPRWIPDTQAQALQNVSLADVTRPERRTGYEEITITDSGIDAGLQSKRIGGLAFMNPSTGTRSVVAMIADSGNGATFYATSLTSGSWAKAYESDGATSWDPGTDNVVSFMANERLWMIGGQATAIRVLDNTHTLTPGGITTSDAPFGAVDGVYLLNRVYLLVGTTVYWSSLLPTTPVGTFTQATDFLTLSPNKGSKGVAIKPWRNQSLIVFFDDSIEELVINAADPSASVRNVIEPNYGCGSRDSIVVVGEDMYFIDQYGHLRSLRRTSQGIIQGIIAAPVSDIVRKVLPGRLNKSRLHRVKAHLDEDKLDIYFPIDLALQANARVRWDFTQNVWTGPDLLGHEVGQLISSNIRNRGNEVFFSNGSTSSLDAAVYRWDDETYDDAGTAITFKMQTKGLAMGVPEAQKAWLWFELEYHGDVGVAPTVSYRLDEVGSYTALTVDNGDTSLAAGSGSDFPLTSFPLTSFPLAFVAPGIARARYILEADAIAKARCIEFQIEEATAGLQFKVVAWRLTAQPKFTTKAGHYGD